MAIRKVISRSIGTDVIVAEDLAANSITVSELSDDAVTTAKIADNNITTAKLHDDAMYRGTFKNKLINGDQQIWQRRTSADETSDGGNPQYPVASDGWYIVNQGNPWATWDFVREEDTPTGQGFKYSSKVTVGSMNSLANSDVVVVGQRVHYMNLFDTAWGTSNAKDITISFWAKSNQTGEFAFSLRYRNSGALRWNKGFTITTADTWQKFSFTVDAPTGSSYDFRDLADIRGSVGLEWQWWLQSGSDYSSSSITEGWQDGNTAIHGDNTISMETASDYFQFTGCQLEIGETVTEFEHLSFDEQLRRCQEFYFKTGAVGRTQEWFPGITTYAGYDNITAASPYSNQDRPHFNLRLPVQMNVSPNITYWPGRSGVTATAGRITVYNGDTSVSTSSQPHGGYGTQIDGYFQGTSTDASMYTFHIEVEGEIG